MGTKRRGADALFSSVQQRLLALLFGEPERSFQSAELIRLAKGGTGGAHRVLLRLAEAGWVTVTRVGNQKHYRANGEAPAFEELRALVAALLVAPAPRPRKKKDETGARREAAKGVPEVEPAAGARREATKGVPEPEPAEAPAASPPTTHGPDDWKSW